MDHKGDCQIHLNHLFDRKIKQNVEMCTCTFYKTKKSLKEDSKIYAHHQRIAKKYTLQLESVWQKAVGGVTSRMM